MLERPLPIAQIRKFKPELVAEVDRLLDQHCDREIADILNQRGWRTWEEKPFNLKKIAFIRTAYKLPSRHERLRRRRHAHDARGRCTLRRLQDRRAEWGRQGLITKCSTDELKRGLWEMPPEPDHPQGLRRARASPGPARSHHRAISE